MQNIKTKKSSLNKIVNSFFTDKELFDLVLKELISKFEVEKFKLLFSKKNLNPNYIFYDKINILEYCILENEFEIFIFLLEKGANPYFEISTSGNILFLIARNYTFDKFKKIFEKYNFNENQESIFGYNLLHLASRNKFFGLEILKYLLKNTNLNIFQLSKNKFSVLDIALYHDNHDVIKYLFENYDLNISVNHYKEKLQLYQKIYADLLKGRKKI